MATIFDKITFDEKFHSELNHKDGKQQIEELAIKLKPLENEIINDPKGIIEIKKSGSIFTVSFPEELAAKITDLVTGRLQ